MFHDLDDDALSYYGDQGKWRAAIRRMRCKHCGKGWPVDIAKYEDGLLCADCANVWEDGNE